MRLAAGRREAPWSRRSAPPLLLTLRLLPAASRRLSAALAVVVLLTAVLPAAFALASGALVGSIGGTVDAGWGSPAGHRLARAIAAVVALFVLQQVSGPGMRAMADALGRRAEGYLRLRVMAATLGPAGVAHLEDPAVADLVTEAQSVGTGDTTVKDATVGIAAVAGNNLAALLSAVVLASYRWWLAVALFAVCAATTRVLAGQFLRTIAALRGHARRFRRSSYFRDLALGPAAAKELRLFGLAPEFGQRFADQWRLAMQAFWRDRRRGQWLPPVGVLLLAGSQGVAYALLARSAARGEISLGELTTFAGATAGVAAVFSLGWDTVNISYGCAPVPAAIELERTVAEARFQLGGTLPADGLPTTGIDFAGVSFRYPGRSDPVFDRLDLHIPAGRSLAIVGPNGAGKTTLVKLLTRLYDPTSGRISVDGIDLASIDASAWQRRVAAIFQDFTRYRMSAVDNVGLGAADRDGGREALAAAAERAGATDIIEALPAGWDTILSPRAAGGVDLSGGEWQRVALARALYAVEAGASILILDEPTAALDVRAEAEFYDRFLELTSGLTTIVISHRFSTVRRADRIVVIEEGRVSEAGDHASLLAAGGRYARMFRLQATHFGAGHLDLGAGQEREGGGGGG